jgi:hypothetical protein
MTSKGSMLIKQKKITKKRQMRTITASEKQKEKLCKYFG